MSSYTQRTHASRPHFNRSTGYDLPLSRPIILSVICVVSVGVGAIASLPLVVAAAAAFVIAEWIGMSIRDHSPGARTPLKLTLGCCAALATTVGGIAKLAYAGGLQADLAGVAATAAVAAAALAVLIREARRGRGGVPRASLEAHLELPGSGSATSHLRP